MWFMNMNFFNLHSTCKKIFMGFYENFEMGKNLYVYARKGNRLTAVVQLELAVAFLVHSKSVICLDKSFYWIALMKPFVYGWQNAGVVSREMVL